MPCCIKRSVGAKWTFVTTWLESGQVCGGDRSEKGHMQRVLCTSSGRSMSAGIDAQG